MVLDEPAKFNPGSDISNSLVSSGCIINGSVEDSVLFKQVFVGKNTTVKNCVLLNDVYIGDNVHLENCIVESRGTINPNTCYCGEDEVMIVKEKNVNIIYLAIDNITQRSRKNIIEICQILLILLDCISLFVYKVQILLILLHL